MTGPYVVQERVSGAQNKSAIIRYDFVVYGVEVNATNLAVDKS
jgi:hypothetical protein